MPEAIGAVAEILDRKYGGRFAVSVENVTLGTSPASILPNDPERVFALIVNMTQNVVYLGYDGQITTTRSMIMGGSGADYQVDIEDDLVLPAMPHFGFASAAATDLTVFTVRRVGIPGQEA